MADITLIAGIDPTLPDVTLEIGGKVRRLAYDFGAIVATEKLTGLNLMKAASFNGLSFTEVRGLLYASLLHHDPQLKIDELNDWPILYNLITIQAAVADAWFGSVTPPKKDALPGEDKARPRTRKRA